MGVDELLNFQRLLKHAGLLEFQEALLGEMESKNIESPEDALLAFQGGLLESLGIKVFDAARFARMFKDQTEGGPEPGSAPASSLAEPLSALRMREGQVVSTANEFLFECKLSRYSAELLTGGGLQLADVLHATEKQLLAVGVTKEFHRKRFLREARHLGPPDMAQPNSSDGQIAALDGLGAIDMARDV